MKEIKQILSKKFEVVPKERDIQDFLYDLFLERRISAYDAFMIMQKVYNRYDEPLKLGDVVACNKKGEVIERPEPGMCFDVNYYKEYQKAKEAVIFDGMFYDEKRDLIIDEFKTHIWAVWNKSKTISDMVVQPINKQFFNFIG